MIFDEHCFFCNPDKERIIHRSDNFYAILGLGPIVEGYTILVSKKHYRSILDLPLNLLKEHLFFKHQFKKIIKEVYGECIIVEHGRIKSCSFYDENAHDSHCYHAHQLIFPVNVDILSSLSENGYQMVAMKSIEQAKTSMDDSKEYLYFENTTGQIYYCSVNYKYPRQFLRLLIAEKLGVSYKANWKKFEGWKEIEMAKIKYQPYFDLLQSELVK